MFFRATMLSVSGLLSFPATTMAGGTVKVDFTSTVSISGDTAAKLSWVTRPG